MIEDLERLLLILESHSDESEAVRDPDDPGESPLLHAILHEVAETALAQGHAAEHDQLQQLLAAGLTRHEAIHRIGREMVARQLPTTRRSTKSPRQGTSTKQRGRGERRRRS